jgi:Rsm1-like
LYDVEASLEEYNAREATFLQVTEDSLPEILSPEPNVQTKVKAGLLAMFGWALQMNDKTALIICCDCQRRAVVSSDREFDIIAEHQEYCPWICERTQDGEMGWKMLVNHISAFNKKNETSEQVTEANAYDEEASIARLRKLRKALGLKS